MTMPTPPEGILELALEQCPTVSLREEPFGALAYDAATRRLTFLKRRSLSDVVGRLDGRHPVRRHLQEAGVPAQEWNAHAAALAALWEGGMLRQATPSPTATGPGGAAATGPVPTVAQPSGASGLTAQFEAGLAAPICLTWEVTYACNLACRHCLSSSGRRDPQELTTPECEDLIGAFAAMGVFYVNIGGGEPTLRPDFWHLIDYAVGHRVGVKFSTNGSRITDARARMIAERGAIDVQVSLDGATPEVNDALRGQGSYRTAVTALSTLAAAGVQAKLSVVITRANAGQLDAFQRIAEEHGATLRLTRLRPSGRGAQVWDELHPTAEQQRALHAWLLAAGDSVLTGDSFFHLGGLGAPLPGLNLCGAGRVVCLVDPVGDVYACPFAIHDRFRAGSVREPGGFSRVWRESATFTALRSGEESSCTACSAYDACRGGCMAAKFFTGLPLDGPDPECVRGASESALREPRTIPSASVDHSRSARTLIPLQVLR